MLPLLRMRWEKIGAQDRYNLGGKTDKEEDHSGSIMCYKLINLTQVNTILTALIHALLPSDPKIAS